MAKDYFQSQEFKDILNTYEKEKEQGKSVYLDAEDFADIADYYLDMDKPMQATEAAEMGLFIHPDEEVLQIVKSGIFLYLRRYDEAEAILKNLDAENSDVKYQYAQLLYAKYNDTEGAEKVWREWMQMDNGENPTEEQKRENYIHVITSMTELRGRDPKTGDRLWDIKAVRRWVSEYIEKFQPLGTDESDVELADICRENDLADLMSIVLTQVLEEEPYLPKGWSNLGLALFVQQKYEQALESCAFALAIDPDDLDALLTKAHTLHAMGEKQASLPVFKEYLDKGGEVVQIIPYAETLILDGKKEEAQHELDWLTSYFENRKLECDIKKSRANSLPEEEREMELTMCEEFYDLYKRINTDVGDLYHRNHNYKESIQAYSRVLAVDSTCSEAYFMLGINNLALSNYEEASSNFAKALQWAEDQVMMGVDIALTFVLNNFDDFALEVLNAISQIAPQSNSPFKKNIPAAKSLTYLKKGYTDQFLKYFDIACRETPGLVQKVYKGYFPEDMPVNQWADYANEHIDALMKKFSKEDLHITGFS